MTTARCGSQRMIRAPIATSLSTKKRRLSNIFSKTSTVPCACVATTTAIDVRSAGNAGHGPSSIFGICAAEVVLDHELLARAGRARSSSPTSTSNAEALERRQDRDQIARLDVLDREVAVRSTAARPMKLPTSMCSGAIAPRAAAELRRRPGCGGRSTRSPLSGAERDEEAGETLDVRGRHAALPLSSRPGASAVAMNGVPGRPLRPPRRGRRLAGEAVAPPHPERRTGAHLDL